MKIFQTRFDNGCTVIVAPMADVPSVTVGIWVRVGARHERLDQTGITHFIEHLLFKGTPSRSPRAISEAIEGVGGYLNAFTQEESTCYYARVPSDRMEDSVDVLCDMYRRACCAEADVAKERDVILEEIAMYRDQPAQQVEEILGQALWAGHPIGQPIAGDRKTVSRFTRRQIVSFMRRSYVPESTLIVATGDVDVRRAVEWFRRRLGDMRAVSGLKCLPVLDSTPQKAFAVGQAGQPRAETGLFFQVEQQG
jgi:predicted Zn-dependent peptidase